MQDQRDIERALGGRRRLVPFNCQRKLAAWESEAVGFDDRLAFANAVVGGDDHGDLRSQADRFANVGVVIVVLFVRVVESQR